MVPGSIYDLDYKERGGEPPHTEDIAVHGFTQVGAVADLAAEIRKNAAIHNGPLESCYDGALRVKASNGNLGVGTAKVPDFSTQFWISDRPFIRHTADKNGREQTRFLTETGIDISYVGDAEPPEVIMPGDLVRLSLARWLRHQSAGLVCWLQISHVYGSAS